MPRSRCEMEYYARLLFTAPPPVVWSAMEDLEQFDRWSKGLGRVRIDGDGLSTGSVLRGSVAPPVPYRMQLWVELRRCVPGSLLDATVHGDLEGAARVALEPAGEGTRLDVAWAVEMMQRPMRLAARVAYPLLRWGHDRVVDVTVRGFRAHVRELADGEGA